MCFIFSKRLCLHDSGGLDATTRFDSQNDTMLCKFLPSPPFYPHLEFERNTENKCSGCFYQVAFMPRDLERGNRGNRGNRYHLEKCQLMGVSRSPSEFIGIVVVVGSFGIVVSSQ